MTLKRLKKKPFVYHNVGLNVQQQTTYEDVY